MKYSQWRNWMIEHPWSFKCGKGKLAKKYNVPEEWIIKVREEVKNKNLETVKILILDIETSPMKAYVWKRWKENISLDQTISEWFMISWAAKWLNDSNTLGDCITPEEAKKEDDSRICSSLWDLLDQADIVIAHNAKHFDIPKINSRFISNNLPPTSSFKIIDTLNVAQKQFGFSSNKLDALAINFGIQTKLNTDFTLWRDCLNGDQEALDYMLKYNKMDVEILEKVYLKLRPWIKDHPNIATISNSSRLMCPICGSEHIIKYNNKYHHTVLSKYQQYYCADCGATLRDRHKINKQTQLISV